MGACRVLSSAGQGSKTFCETRAKVKYRDQSFIPNIHFCYAQHCQVQGTVAYKVTHAPESTISSPSSGERYLIYEFH